MKLTRYTIALFAICIAPSWAASVVASLDSARSATSGLGEGSFDSFLLSVNPYSGTTVRYFDAPRLNAPSSTGSSNSLSTLMFATAADTSGSGDSGNSSPVFVMDPNFGFRVVLTADFTDDGAYVPSTIPLFGLANPDTPPIVNLSSTPTVTTQLPGISSDFLSVPIGPGTVSTAGQLYTDNTVSTPTVIFGGTTDGTDNNTSTTPTASDPAAPSSADPSAPKPPADPMGAPIGDTVPEPATAVGVASALLALGWFGRKRISRIRQ